MTHVAPICWSGMHAFGEDEGQTRISQSSGVRGVTDTERAFVGLYITDIST